MPTRCQPGRRRNALHSKARDARGNGSTTASTAGACSHTGLRTKVSSCMRPPNQGIRKHRLHASAVATRFNLDRSEFQFFERASEGRRPHPPTPTLPCSFCRASSGKACAAAAAASRRSVPKKNSGLAWQGPLAGSGDGGAVWQLGGPPCPERLERLSQREDIRALGKSLLPNACRRASW